MHCFRIGVEKGMKLCIAVQEGCGYKDILRVHHYVAPLAKYFTVCITYQPPLVQVVSDLLDLWSVPCVRFSCPYVYTYMLTCIKHSMVQNLVIITLGCGINRYIEPDILTTVQLRNTSLWNSLHHPSISSLLKGPIHSKLTLSPP